MSSTAIPAAGLPPMGIQYMGGEPPVHHEPVVRRHERVERSAAIRQISSIDFCVSVLASFGGRRSKSRRMESLVWRRTQTI